MAMLLVGIGAGIGASLRYLITNFYKRKVGGVFPGATLFLNLSGAFMLGYLTSLALADPRLPLLLGTGLLGGYTTFSTYNTELLVLVRDRRWKLFLIYFITTYGGGLALAYIGLMLGR
ncbi:fluoride efflux transporter CrcB [Ligilactobacillus ceti]|uniref:Fluoride-specific ion channel FluC n=1 Tax=Ligilactobacillus ceti DSM 22408 TaxID=1122146 RepID=A0A0R2KKA2_9LACO|nr:fluoride efflux transporter CrcB [Ligilactobacillus ceti]KRN89807.1 hypothetical protein IV53_GL001134 [Ligilactobacillus ceti DSM 22408]